MTTSSPGFQRVTPSPTFQTIPEASEPPMWWPYSGGSPEPETETGLPSEAQTLLKLTPAAITRTTTSKAPGSGTSICSSWKASFGSPSRSCPITQAAIVSGGAPGVTSSWVRLLVSTAKFPILPVGFPPAARDPRWCGGTSDGSRRVALALGVHLGGGLAKLRCGDRADRDVGRLRRLDLL